MSVELDGGPAWPVTGEGAGGTRVRSAGMSLRDYAAIHADLSSLTFRDSDSLAAYMGETVPADMNGIMALSARAVAKARYVLADAMLAAREKGRAAEVAKRPPPTGEVFNRHTGKWETQP